MKYKRNMSVDRRQNISTRSTPYKDCTGASVRKCRRRIPDRRTDSVQAAMIDLFHGGPVKSIAERDLSARPYRLK
jgi:hypothetical protein